MIAKMPTYIFKKKILIQLLEFTGVKISYKYVALQGLN